MKRGTPRHPKTKDLEDRLVAAGVPRWLSHPAAVGILECLWHFTAEFAPQGDIGRYSNKRIAGACGWEKNADLLVDILTASKWIDSCPLLHIVVHDWSDHADESVRKRLARANLPFLSAQQDSDKVTEHRQTLPASVADNGSLPKPLPLPKPLETETKAVSVSGEFLEPPGNGTKPKRKVSPETIEKRERLKAQQKSWFEEFRTLFVWKWEGEDSAWKMFSWKVKTEEVWKMVKAAVIAQTRDQLSRDDVRFRTCPTKWLNDGKWKDKPTPNTPLFPKEYM